MVLNLYNFYSMGKGFALFVYHLRLVGMEFSVFLFLNYHYYFNIMISLFYWILFDLISVITYSCFLLIFEEVGFRIFICCGSNMNCLLPIKKSDTSSILTPSDLSFPERELLLHCFFSTGKWESVRSVFPRVSAPSK